MPSSGPRRLGACLAFPCLVAAGAGLLTAGMGVSGALPLALAAVDPTPRSEAAAAASPGADAEASPLVRVLIRQQPTLLLAAAASPLRLADGQGRSLGQIAAEQPFQLRQEQAGLVVVMPGAAGSGESLVSVSGDLWIVPLPAPGRSSLLTVEGHLYRGRLQVRAGGDGRLLVINQLPLERYLQSVVGSEMPATWPLAALRAQAVAARTYALSQLKPTAPFDLQATVASQVYRGVESETDSTRAAVASTRSEVLMQGRSLINAVFHSSSGGSSTENSGDVWSRQFPYLVSVADFDQRSPMHQWQQRIEPDELRRAFRETAGVSRIDVLAVSRSGRIRRARVSGPAGSLELSGAQLRQRLGLRSTLVKAFRLEPVALDRSEPERGAIGLELLAASSGTGPRGVPQTGTAGPRRAASDVASVPAEPSLAEALLDSATGAITGLLAPPPSIPAPEAAPSGPGAGPGPRSTAPATAIPQPALELVVEGRGFGHGVGMSQWGAYAMALQGRSYDQILRHYYRGVDLKPYVNP